MTRRNVFTSIVGFVGAFFGAKATAKSYTTPMQSFGQSINKDICGHFYHAVRDRHKEFYTILPWNTHYNPVATIQSPVFLHVGRRFSAEELVNLNVKIFDFTALPVGCYPVPYNTPNPWEAKDKQRQAIKALLE